MRQGGLDGEAVRLRNGRARDQPSAADSRRLRIHQGLPARTLLARRAPDQDFRRHFRNPVADHLRSPAAEGTKVSTSISKLTGKGNYFEDFEVGAKMRHARGTTIGEIENQMLTKLVLNTADGHYNEHRMPSTQFGQRLVFGLVTGSVCIGLATQDTGENALAELGLTGIRFTSPVFHGDTLYAYTEVLEKRDADRDDAGIVRFKQWGTKHEGTIVFGRERTVLITRSSHWGNR